jgi:arylamine N-acetyltransferase
MNMSSSQSQSPTYTDSQLTQYLSMLFPESHSFSSLAAVKEKLQTDPIPTLTTLQTHHLGTIPWGDVGLHYSTTKTVSLDAEDVFEKIVLKKLGGYCMEVNTFYAIVLRSLGLKLYVTGGRISNAIDAPGKRDPEGFAGWYVFSPISFPLSILCL